MGSNKVENRLSRLPGSWVPSRHKAKQVLGQVLDILSILGQSTHIDPVASLKSFRALKLSRFYLKLLRSDDNHMVYGGSLDYFRAD